MCRETGGEGRVSHVQLLLSVDDGLHTVELRLGLEKDGLSEVVDGGAMTGMASVAMRSKIRELMPASAFARRRSRSWVMSAPEAEIPLG
ncbi:MAG: hypothetical protein ACTJH1_07565, partial [Corynebacterium variabile]